MLYKMWLKCKVEIQNNLAVRDEIIWENFGNVIIPKVCHENFYGEQKTNKIFGVLNEVNFYNFLTHLVMR
jgi:hypothetical protein